MEKHNQLIQKNIPLHNKNWFGTGGPARLYAQAKTEEEFSQALAFARAQNTPIFLLGSGANILISDDGFDGLVIHPCLKDLSITYADNHALVSAGAGVEFDDLIEYCLSNNLLGLEEFSGIPGTVGGSVFINIHYFEFLLDQFLTSARVINLATGEIAAVDHAWFAFGYNTSRLHQEDYALLEATFKLKPCSEMETAFARGRKKEIIRHRKQRYPNSHTCGSFFRNFYADEVTLTSNGKKMIFVAYYLDKIGVKGQLRHGDAVVSYQHANMIVNQGKATSSDLINLARTMQELVKEHYGIVPQPECRLIGFKDYPLLKH